MDSRDPYTAGHSSRVALYSLWIARKLGISHTTTGARILSKIEPEERMRQAALVAKYHHEKVDGTGYPEGLRGEEIPFHARIVAVADAFDAITTDRPYAKGRTYREGVREIIRCKGTHFDPTVVEDFEQVMQERDLDEELQKVGTEMR